MKQMTTIGWREWASLPDWGIVIRAKADTGAKSSAIDCSSIEELAGDRVRFTLRLSLKSNETLTLETPIAMRKHVRSSTGHGHDRIFVETTLELGGAEKKILVSLTCRKRMNHRMLLGREALAGSFLVDSSVDHWATPRVKKALK
ncbi:ATP-dependent zinc protease family protein [Persicirhabdus sediminis]|uniref:ATP-dependent zinc protease n=1 Tax=Persicirhabdus sediminis TaxID=454144 RepID=A0A8J7SMB6_9BACT|nr:RimK/LysX family protein [Persicirhabdus sediminis]MBK1791965.1 ATP-dependent zinc protease [Persicirhabdus sediminis]